MNQDNKSFIFNHLQLIHPLKTDSKVNHPEVVESKGLSELIQKSESASESGESRPK